NFAAHFLRNVAPFGVRYCPLQLLLAHHRAKGRPRATPKSEAETLAHSESLRETVIGFEWISREVLWSAMRLRIAFIMRSANNLIECPCGTLHGVIAAQTCNRTARSPRQTASVLIREVHHRSTSNNVRGWNGCIGVMLPGKCPVFRRRCESRPPNSRST